MDLPIELRSHPIESFDLGAIAGELEREESFWASRRTAASLVKGEDLTVVLTVVMKGETVREHAAPRSAVVVVLDGEIIVRFPDREERLKAGAAVAFAAHVRHAVEATEDARFLVVIGGEFEPTHVAP